MTAVMAGHIHIARFSHWVKNVLVLPGIIVALTFDPSRLGPGLVYGLAAGLVSIGLMSSSNYVLNEILDAPFDSAHPTKRSRPIPLGLVPIPIAYLEWLGLALAGIATGITVSREFTIVILIYWLMGCAYNVRPVRLKDVPFLDVLAEGLNNPLRLIAGWYLTGTDTVPVASLCAGYWMAGCYFMTVKRFAEFRRFDGSAARGAYRRSLASYSEPRLLSASLFYAALSMLFFGAFLMRYQVELVLSFPFVGLVMARYLSMSFQPDSPAERPEKLYQDRGLVLASLVCTALMSALLFTHIPLLHDLFPPTYHRP